MQNLIVRLEAALAAVFVLGVVSVFPASDSPQAPAAGPDEPVAIDFRALTSDGQPILDLGMDDVTLKIDGRVREISSLELVRLPTSEPGAAEALPPLPFATNDLSTVGRDTIVVIDDESFPPGKEPVVRNAVELLLSGMSAGDRVGLLTTPRPAFNINATSQLGTIRQAMGRLVGQAVGAESAENSACRTRTDLEALQGLFRKLSGETMTAVLFFSSGMLPPASEAARPGTAPGLCEVRSQDFQDVAAARAGAPVSFYVVQIPQDLGGSSTSSNNLLAGLESLAAVTGGQWLPLVGQKAEAMLRVLRETSARYRLTFVPDAAERNGNSHRVELKVGRDRVRLHARERVTIPKAAGRSGAKAMTPITMLGAARMYSDVSLAVTGCSSRNPGDAKVKVVVLFQPLDSAVKLASAVVGLFDSKGTLRAQANLGASDLARRPVTTALVVPAGQYRLRVAAVDASGRGGSVEEEMRAELGAAGPMKLSSMAFGVAQGGGFAPRLLFGEETASIVYFEIYGVPKTGSVSASLELAASENGPALVTGPAAIGTGPQEDTRIVMSQISIATVPPGDILVRGIVSLDGQPVGRVSRTLRKTAR